METMKAVQLLAPRKTVLSDLPVPETPADGLLMKTRCVSICSTDISFYEGHLFPSEYPVVLGHEYLGEVVDIGREFDTSGVDLKIGDRVVYWGQTDFGGFAEYRTVRPIFSGQVKEDIFEADRNFYDDKRAAAVKIPDELSDLEASFIEPVTGALRSVLSNPPKVGDKVLILGTGPIGVIAGSVIKRLLAPNMVVSVDTNPARNEFAEQQFSNKAYLPDELIESVDESTFDYVFDALPTVKVADESKDPRRVAMRKLKAGGRYVLYGASQEMQKFDTWLMLAKGINIISAPFDVNHFPMHKSANVIASAMQMLLTGIVDGKALLSTVHKFDDYDGLVDIFENYRFTTDLKTIVDFRRPDAGGN
ncbi:alcohol dehydrogenase catalytic domain-containing protein [Streptomyces sp. RKAG290]|uniref:zinc-dependent alcohol dehydrogenase n=1 Tax=Streptomyces sp. RKAG290 TaxID=2888348 RepID=UPI00203479CE|nr:alcohol dehydrogenase catalytic domain-containing protein [Streptomyces sp. RKAG290]MCM2416261.1 alcohol dehydrogenase catalytic domain-containing protein [Streptomyces sp. RKAG290]